MKEYIEAGAKAPVPKIYKDMYEAFNDPEVEVVLNLTRPYEHYGVTKAALEHGKHVFSEKPLAADMEEGDELVALAEEKGLLMGGAPSHNRTPTTQCTRLATGILMKAFIRTTMFDSIPFALTLHFRRLNQMSR